jgi:hypothetical protein
LIKIFPTRFLVENADKTEQLWKWINSKVQNSKITQVVPLDMEHSSSQTSHVITGLIEVHCTENVTIKEFQSILEPLPGFIHHVYFTFQ